MADVLYNEEKDDEPLVGTMTDSAQETATPVSAELIISPTIVGKYLNIEANGDVTIGDYAGGQGIFWDQSAGTLNIMGGLVIDYLDIPDTTTANSFHVNTTGDAWWGSTAIGTAVAKILATGSATFTDVTITGGSVAVSTLNGTLSFANLDVAIQGWSQTCAFSVTDADTVAWAAGTFTTAGGTTYNIGAGNTGNMVAKTYIYLDTAVSTVAYQVTTTAATAVGAGKCLVAIAQNAVSEATYQVMYGMGGLNIDAANIVAGTITANELNTSITYAGSLIIDTNGVIRGGQTAYNTGTGWFIGYSGATYKLSIGNPAGNYLTWDGTNMNIKGEISIVALGDTIINAADTYRETNSGTPAKLKEIRVLRKGDYRITFELKCVDSVPPASARIYKNEVVLGTLRQTNETTFQSFTEDFTDLINAGDLLRLYAWCSEAGQTVAVQNFRVKGDRVKAGDDVVTD